MKKMHYYKYLWCQSTHSPSGSASPSGGRTGLTGFCPLSLKVLGGELIDPLELINFTIMHIEAAPKILVFDVEIIRS